MNVPPPELLDEELLAIAKTIRAPDSRAGQMMEIKKANHSDPWNDEADSRRARAGIDKFQENMELAAQMLATGNRS